MFSGDPSLVLRCAVVDTRSDLVFGVNGASSEGALCMNG